MAHYDLEEQEQLSQLKAWWEQNGKYVTGLIVAAAVASVSWQGWNWYQNKKADEAAGLYYVLHQAAGAGEAARARDAAGQLVEGYSGSAYATMGALLSAAAQVDGGDVRNARAQLDWVMKHADEALVRDLARLRLGILMFDEGDLDGALAQLSAAPHEALRARYADVRGDVLFAAGRRAEAREAYQEVLNALGDEQSQAVEMVRSITRVKLESLEG